MRMRSHSRLRVALLALSLVATIAQTGTAVADSSLVIVIEGLRGEYVTRAFMPNLRSLAKNGTQFESHYAVFPFASHVNAVTIATGSYPGTHGVLRDGIHGRPVIGVPSTEPDAVPQREKVQERSDYEGGAITAPTLGGILSDNQMRTIVVSARGDDVAYLLEPFPTSSSAFAGSSNTPGNERNEWAVNAYVEAARSNPDVALLWLAEPGEEPRASRMSEPWTKNTARALDAQIGRILGRHRKSGDSVNVFVTSDIGPPAPAVPPEFVQLFEEKESKDFLIGRTQFIYVPGNDRAKIRDVVQWLQRQKEVGPIYTQQVRLTHPESFVRGALSFQAVFMDHERVPDIYFEPSSAQGSYGVGRTSLDGLESVLIASGPSIKKRETISVPSANYDLAPTLLTIAGITPPESMDGRVLSEALVGGPDPESVEVLRRRHGSEATWEGGGYRLVMTELSVGGTDYFDSTQLTRGAK